MSNHYLQWITGQRRGEVEAIELMQDGQTGEDVAILPNGRKAPMNQVGKEFIVLPSAGSALNSFDLDIMYPRSDGKSNRKASQTKKAQAPVIDSVDHASIMGMDAVQVTSQYQRDERKKKTSVSSFATDLLTRAKKSDTGINIKLDVEMPSRAFFDMVTETFDSSTLDEVVELITDSIDQNYLMKSIKNSILEFYERKSL